jgi:hypothetical protein
MRVLMIFLNVGAFICLIIGIALVWMLLARGGRFLFLPLNVFVFAVEIAFILLSFTPCFMLSKGFIHKKWQLAMITSAETITIGFLSLFIWTLSNTSMC